MKYMTFNSSCSFAGVANMLESKVLENTLMNKANEAGENW